MSYHLVYEHLIDDYRSRVVCDVDPERRSVQYSQHKDRLSNCYDTKDGIYLLKLPFIRAVMDFQSTETAEFGVCRWSWDGRLFLLGSLEPYESLDQRVFPLPLPNLDSNGELTCVGSMRYTESLDKEKLCQLVLNNFWSSSFSYWPVRHKTGTDFRVLQGGVETLKTIALTKQLSEYIIY